MNKLLATALMSALSMAALAQNKPAELKIGITTFMSGPASVFGVPAKAAAEQIIDDINGQGGIGGVKLSATFIDEGAGADKMLSEYRRVVQEMGVKTMIASISSGNWTVAPKNSWKKNATNM
jgi:branched-chain amino acid transport system substrate-binding protein